MSGTLHDLTVDAMRELVRRTVDDTARKMIGEKISAAFDADEGRRVRLQVVQSLRKFLPDATDEDQNASSE